jgi:hypothetical protein
VRCQRGRPERADKDAQCLLQRMLQVGLSRYEPDPRFALLKFASEYHEHAACAPRVRSGIYSNTFK